MSSDWLLQLERQLERLEQQTAADDLSAEGFHAALQDAVAVLVDGAPAELWLVSKSLTAPNEPHDRTSSPVNDSDTIVRRFNTDGSTSSVDNSAAADIRKLVQSGSHLNDSRQLESKTHSTGFRAGIIPGTQCVLTVSTDQILVPKESAAQAFTSIVTLAAAFLARYLLTHSQDQRKADLVLLQLGRQLAVSRTTAQAASVMAQELAVLLPHGRVTVLMPAGNRLHPAAVSGVREPNPDSETCRAIIQAAQTIPDDVWTPLKEVAKSNSAVKTLLEQQMELARVLRLRRGKDDSLLGLVVLEAGRKDSTHRLDDHFFEQLSATATGVLEKGADAERTWVQRLLPSGRIAWLVVAMAVIAFLMLWPTRFEVEVNGHVSAENHLRIFAPDDGVIADVSFRHREQVAQDELLLRLDNPDLLLELKRVEGEIQATAAELSSVLAERLTADDPTLSAKEQRLQTRLESLEEQQRLIETRSQQLQVIAPFAGRVFRHNPQQDLVARPVQRGQLLLELVPDDANWQLEVFVPDHLERYVREALQQNGISPVVRFLLRSSPEREYASKLIELDFAVQIRDGLAVCQGMADLSEQDLPELRPGATVIARIDCGTRPIGFVWFRELIHYGRTFRFAWL